MKLTHKQWELVKAILENYETSADEGLQDWIDNGQAVVFIKLVEQQNKETK